MTTHTIKMCRPDATETGYQRKLFHAAQRVENRWGSDLQGIAEALVDCSDLSRAQKLFLLRAWQVLVDDKGGFGRWMGAFDTYVHCIQDPNVPYVAFKPELQEHIDKGYLFDTVLEAYQDALQEVNALNQRIKELEAHQLSTAARIAELENDEVRQRLANAEHQLHMAELANHNLRASRRAQFHKRRAAEKRIAALDAKASTPALYLCKVTRGGEELYSECGKDYPRGRAYYTEARPLAVKLPEEFLRIGESLRTQDNRVTDQPMFVVLEKLEIIGSDEHSPSRIVWCEDGEEVSPLRAKRLESLHQECRATNGYDRYAMQEIDVFVTACFTEQGCKDYLVQNGHNLRLPYIFASGSFRNNEYQQVRNWLMTVGTVGGE